MIDFNIMYDIEKDNQLGIAAENNDDKVAEFFLKHGTNLNFADRTGEKPLIKFIRHGNARMVELLLKAGAATQLKNDNDLSPLYDAINQSNQNDEIIEAIKKRVDPESISEVAQTFKEMGDGYDEKYRKAIVCYSKAIQLNPQYMAAYYNRANAYHNSEMYEEAITDFTNAQKLEPNDPDIFIARANSYEANGMFAEAIADYSKAIELSSENSNIFSYRGYIYFHQGKIAEAILDFQQALVLDSDNTSAEDGINSIFEECDAQSILSSIKQLPLAKQGSLVNTLLKQSALLERHAHIKDPLIQLLSSHQKETYKPYQSANLFFKAKPAQEADEVKKDSLSPKS